MNFVLQCTVQACDDGVRHILFANLTNHFSIFVFFTIMLPFIVYTEKKKESKVVFGY